jgi:hypothetical protein
MCRESWYSAEPLRHTFEGFTAGRLTKSKGRSRKPLAEVYSLERPVARHFVYVLVLHPPCHP